MDGSSFTEKRFVYTSQCPMEKYIHGIRLKKKKRLISSELEQYYIKSWA